MEYPQLRPIEIFPLPGQREPLFALKDPYGLSQEILIFPSSLYFIISHFDGRHSLLDVQAEYMRKYEQAQVDQASSPVSFASMAFY